MNAKKILLGLTLVLFSTPAFSGTQFPLNPQPSLTPGSLCDSPDEFRYPERIRYCNRDVASELKDEIVRRYDATFGYQVGKIGRHNFKIDHYIPLCLGGSNDETNLWPQHPSVYEITDPLESKLCEKLSEGKIKQTQAIELVKKGKNNLKLVAGILTNLESL